MRTIRNLSALLFVCVAIVVFNARAGAIISCQNLDSGLCRDTADRYGKGCTVTGNGDVNCSQFLQTLAGYCDPDSYDTGHTSCDSNTGQGWCSASQQCTCGGSSASCTLNSQCCSGLVCNQSQGQCSTNESPILINLRSNAAEDHLTSAANGVVFDIDADGVLDQVAWTEANAPVAFLALDRNQNGTIDNGAELFGNATPKADGTTAANGFEALEDLDGGPGVSDGQIDARDAAYARLRLWLDRNHNGISEADELITLEQAGVTRILTRYHESRRVDRYGNAYRYVGVAMLHRDGHEVLRRIFDVFLVTVQ
jgi:hypothetical protein